MTASTNVEPSRDKNIRVNDHAGNHKPKTYPTVEDADWPEPTPLPEPMPRVRPLNYDLLPDGLREWIEDISERTQCPPDFPAVGAMVGLASLVGRKIRIRPKRRDDWTVVPNLWGAVVGRPGVMKTPALNAVMTPLRRIEIKAGEEHKSALREHEAAKLVAEIEKKNGLSRIKEAIKNGGDARAVALGVINDTEDAETPPARRRCVTNDSTVEKLGEILADNPNGVLVFRDELTGWLRSLDRDGQEPSRAFYLESWNGDGRYTWDRIGRGTIDIEAAITSVLGGIQPGPLSDYVRSAASDGKGADGLLQRFQLIVWPDISRNWKNIDRWPDTEIKNRAHEIYDRLDALAPDDWGCDCKHGDDIAFLRFAVDAQERFDEWREQLEMRLRADTEHPAFEAHLSKYRSLIPSLALLCHLVEVASGPVGLDALDRAIRWGEYLESHARRLYGSAINADIESAHALANRIKGGELADGFTLREVYQHHWSGLATRDDARRAADVLIDHDILRDESDSTGGRPKTLHRINPRFC